MQLKDLIQALVESRERIKEIDAKYEEEVAPLKEAKKELEAQIIETFKERGEFSTRIEKVTASLSVKKTAQIVDEQALVHELEKQGLDDYVEVRVSDLFKESALKEQTKAKELLPGVAIKETEYLSIRSNEKSDARKIVTE